MADDEQYTTKSPEEAELEHASPYPLAGHEPPYPLGHMGRIIAQDRITIDVNGDVVVTYGPISNKANFDAPTEEWRRIMADRLVDFIESFHQGNTKYRMVQIENDLGVSGEIPDINRKMGILLDRIWYGGAVVGEDTPTVILDMIGHLFLLYDKVMQQEEE